MQAALIGIDFACTDEEARLVSLIADRAAKDCGGIDRLGLRMDITAVHRNGCTLNLLHLLAQSSGDFWHDIGGIREHLDRTTGHLLHHFLPRCAQQDCKARA